MDFGHLLEKIHEEQPVVDDPGEDADESSSSSSSSDDEEEEEEKSEAAAADVAESVDDVSFVLSVLTCRCGFTP